MHPVLNPVERLRYQRHTTLPGFGVAAQERLKNARVLVVGAGGLGCPALLYLAAAGVGQLTVIDPDVVELSNLQRQVLFGRGDLGRHKAEAAAERLRELNDCIEVRSIVARFDVDNAQALCGEADLVLDGSDNFRTRYLVNDACVLSGTPFVHAAVHEFEGQLSVFNHRGGPTYRCLYPEPPGPGARPPCAESGVLGVLPGLLGTLQACEAIKVLSGVGSCASGRLLLIDSLGLDIKVVSLEPQPESRRLVRLQPVEQHAGGSCDARNDEIEPAQLHAMLKTEPGVQLIDVRESSEIELHGAIGGALRLPLPLLEQGMGMPGLDASLPIVVYCAGGARSLRALAPLRRMGYSHARSLKGGYAAWVCHSATRAAATRALP